jgi:hypothetical protein
VNLRILLVLLLTGCAGHFQDAAGPAPEPPLLTLEAWPHREVWTGVVFNGEKIGFTRREVRPAPGAPGRYEIESEAAIRLRFLGVDKRINLRALDRVRPDLTLESFRYEQEIDGSPMIVAGSSDGRSIAFTVEASGSREQRSIELKEQVYPSSALALLPSILGIAVGRSYRHAVFEGETQALAQAEQEVLAWESSDLFEGPAFKVATRLLGLETTTWLSADGRPLFERALQGAMISALEDQASARRYLVEASLNKRDAMLDFSLVRSPPIARPRRVSRLEIALDGLPPGFALPSEGGQACRNSTCIIDRAAPLAQGDPAKYLKATLAAPSNLGEIAHLSRQISQGAANEEERIDMILAWIDANIAKEAIDSFTAVDVLRERRAECQGHAYLFAAFARALGIPARVVNGIAYSEAHGGFLYHTWNEAWIAGHGWRPVDATFGQPHADATHLKLLEGEAPGDLLPLVGLVGRLRVPAVSALAHW